MVNPSISTRPILLIERVEDKYRISTWHTPAGLWRHTEGDEFFATFDEAVARAAPMSLPLGALVAIDWLSK